MSAGSPTSRRGGCASSARQTRGDLPESIDRLLRKCLHPDPARRFPSADEQARALELFRSLSAEEWAAPSDCAGWRVQDVAAHMGAVFHTIADPGSIDGGTSPDVEANAEVPVGARKDWTSAEVLADYEEWSAKGREALVALQGQGVATTVVPLANLGSHPLHLLANALDALGERPQPRRIWISTELQDNLLELHLRDNGPGFSESALAHAREPFFTTKTSAQGLGLGTKLLTLSLDWMETNTDGPLWIGVWSGNDKAQRLYAAYGFENVGEYDYPVGAWRDHEFILRRG